MSKKEFIFIFPGQGSEEIMMGSSWSKESNIFKETFFGLLEYFNEEYGHSLHEIILHYPDELNKTIWCQPAIYCYQIAAAKMLINQFGSPCAVLGHGCGEFAAAVISGKFTKWQGLKLVAERGRLMQKTEKSSTKAIFSSSNTIIPILERHPTWSCWITEENDQNSTIVSGTTEDINKLINSLNHMNIRHIDLPIQTADHTPLMSSISEEWQKIIENIEQNESSIPFYSSIDGKKYNLIDSSYWIRQMFSKVNFKQAINNLYQEHPQITCIELGPQRKLHDYISKKWENTVSLGPEKKHISIKMQLDELAV